MKYRVIWNAYKRNFLFQRLYFEGRVEINSPHLEQLVSSLGEEEIKYKGLTFIRIKNQLRVKGEIYCPYVRGHCCWGIREGCRPECVTRCQAMRITQSFFTYLRRALSPSSGESGTLDKPEAKDGTLRQSPESDKALQEAESEDGQSPDLQEVRSGCSDAEAEGGSGEGTPSTAGEKPEEKTSLGVGCQSSAPEVDTEAAGSAASEEAGAGALQDEALDSRPSGASSSEEGSCETGLGPSVPSGTASLWEAEFNPKEDQHCYGGGGGQAKALSARDSKTSVERQVTSLLRRFFAEIEDLFRKEEGQNRWDARKVIYSSTLAPQDLPTSKFSRPVTRKISLWVDVSGSVSHLTGFIINLITAACKDKDVQVVIGSEAHPECVLPDSFVKSGKTWREYYQSGNMDGDNYIHDFDIQVAKFLKDNRLEAGQTIVIWSDYMDIHADNLSHLSTLLKPYKVVWLCSHDGKDRGYSGNESFKLEKFAKKEGHLFLWGIDSPEGIKKAIKYLTIRKGGK